MTRASVGEYADALRARYRKGTKAEKGRLLDQFCQTTGYHRESAIRLLGREPVTGQARRGRPPTYGLAVQVALERVWVVSGHLCAKCLAPFLPELVDVLERQGELTLPAPVRAQLTQVSAATIDRLLRSARRRERRLPLRQTRAASAVQAQIPLRTWSEWQGVTPGSLQADLVLHGGESGEGFFLTTVDTVDVATGWTECAVVWGKGQQRVGGAVDRIRRRLPLDLRELHTDNGGEFLNGVLVSYCRRHGIRCTRGRPWKKNDQAYVEQKNWSVVRKVVGYQRFESKDAYLALERLYAALCPYVNFFQPLRKLVAKEREGARVRKQYDVARTPYQRLVASGVLTAEQEAMLAERYRALNPVALRAEITAAQDALWRTATRVVGWVGQQATDPGGAEGEGTPERPASLPTR